MSELIEQDVPAVDSIEDWAALKLEAAQVEKKSGNAPPETEKEAAPDALDIPSNELIGDAVSVLSDIFAPNWNINPDECAQLGSVYGRLIDKYMPDLDMSKYAAEIGAVVVTGMIIRTRVGVPLRLPEKTQTSQDDDAKKPEKETEAKQTVINANDSGVLTAKAVK